ncbi:hypothetical protein GCM10028773_56120 [Spirosoma koreense]
MIVAFFCTGVSLSMAQQASMVAPIVKFGSITPAQFANTTADSTAEAVVLYDYGEVNFDLNGSLALVATYHVRMQIRKKSAYDRATIQIPIRRGTTAQHEQVTDFDGYTYNLTNGTVSVDRLAKTGHFTEKVTNQLWVEKYTLPNVREGAVIEYKYTVRTPFNINNNPKTWRFQQDIPVNWSEYRVAIPDYFYYKVLQGGYLSIKGSEKKIASTVEYRFSVKDIPAFRNEAYITTADDYLAKVDFELASYQLPGQMLRVLTVDWAAMDKILLEDASFGGQFKRAGFLRETARSLLSQHPDTLGQIAAAYDFVNHAIKWNEESGYWSANIKKVFDDKKGDAGDMNLMLIALLREMELDANPVILSTRSHGRFDTFYPLLKKFNYVVAHVMVGGKDLLLDATDPYLPLGMLPIRCLNGEGRLVHPTKPRFIPLLPAERDVEIHTGTFTLNEDGEVTGTLLHSHGGYSAWSTRKEFASSGKPKFIEAIQKKRPSWQIDKVDFPSAELKTGAFSVKYTLTIPEASTKAGDRLYLRPMLTEAQANNPFKEAERLYPVDLGVPIEEIFTATYTLPTGFQVEELPKAVSMTIPEDGGRFLYQVSVNSANQLQVASRLLLRRPTYSASEYSALRELFSRVVAIQAEQVVLKRGDIAEKK